jgi:hypothetical protein
VYRELTVAHVRGSEEEDHVEVLFLESARIYRLERARPDFEELLGRLQEGRHLRVAFTQPDGEVIEDVQDATATPTSGGSDD